MCKMADTKQWRKGGMTYGGLRDSTQARNYFYGPGRQNIIPDANPNGTIVSSIGLIQNNGVKQVLAGPTGPGTFSNVNVNGPSLGYNDEQQGVLQSNPNKVQFVNYRNTDPVLVNNLRNNPLSIYATGQNVKDAPIPEFFANISPDNYNTYVNLPGVKISDEIKELYIDGSPNVSILGLEEQNPLMGLGRAVPNSNPKFSGKVYGGTDSGNANHIAAAVYGMGRESNCTNKALAQFSQGYNVAPQLIENRMIVEGPHVNNNLPWGPGIPNRDPRKQQGGIWPGPRDLTPAIPQGISNKTRGMDNIPLPNKFQNPYVNGLPGSLIPN